MTSKITTALQNVVVALDGLDTTEKIRVLVAVGILYDAVLTPTETRENRRSRLREIARLEDEEDEL